MNHAIRGGLLALSCLILSGCQLGNPSTPTTMPAVTISGSVLNASAVAGATITVAGADGVVATTRTDDNGHFGVSVRTSDDPLTVIAQGGSYTAADGSVASSGTLRDVFSYNGTAVTLAVTPLTTVAAGLFDYFRAQGLPAIQAVTRTETDFTDWLGFDVTSTSPVLPTQATVTQPFDAGLRYGLVLAGLRQWVHTAGGQNTAQLTALMLDDVGHDGLLDGQGAGASLTLGSETLSANAYRHDVALAVMAVAASSTSALSASLKGPNEPAIIAYARTLAESGSPLFGTSVPVSFGTTPLSLTVAPLPEWTHGSLSVAGSVADPFALPVSVTLALDGENYQTVTTNGDFSFTIITTSLSDGMHALGLEAKDAALGDATFTTPLGIDNTPPQACAETFAPLTSGIIIAGHWQDVSGVVSGTLNGQPLQIESNGVWYTQLPTVTPTLVLILNDAAGNSQTFDWQLNSQSNPAPCS